LARVRIALLAVLAVVLLAPAASAKAPPGDQFFTPPTTLPGHAHGDVVWFRNGDANNQYVRLKSAAQNLLVLYRSNGVDGAAVAESGSVAIPKGKPPKGGWPVISWAHGTTGIADQCAPTRLPAEAGGKYSVQLRAILDGYVKAGYAVVQADYEGLGTPGVHPYLIGASEGRAVLDIVRAARKINKGIGKSVGFIGHSQGGHAVLWAAYLARTYTPELKVKGTVAFAPASHVKDQSNLLQILKDPSPISALIAMIFRGADVAFPDLHVQSLLSDQAAALYPQVDQRCLSEMYGTESWGGVAPANILKDGVDKAPLLAAADKSDPENLKIKTPILIVQGTADGTVLPLFTDQLYSELGAKHVKVTYKKINGVDHGPIVYAGRNVARAYLKKKLGR
jgi:pimeloyl-ACP methyl ester carboxylesterase